MKIVNVYADMEGGYAFEYNGIFYGFTDEVQGELQGIASELANGLLYVPYIGDITSSLELDLITTYEFEEN